MVLSAFRRGAWVAGLAIVAFLSITGGVIAAAGSAPATGKGRRPEKTDGVMTVRIEILPGQKEKLVDLALPETIPFVVMSRPGLDARDLDPATLSLAGAVAAKNEQGELAEIRDIDGDGLPDLVAQVYSRQMRIGAGARHVSLSGRTRDGRKVEGTSDLRTVQDLRAERRRTLRPDPTSEKKLPMTVAIDILPGDPGNRIELGNRGTIPAAVLSSADFDATALDPATLTLAGSPATRRGGKGGMGSFEDVNGDGLQDLVVEFPKRFLQLQFGFTEAVLRGIAPRGRFIQGSDRVQIGDKSTMTFDSYPPPPLSQPGPEFIQTAGILLNDAAVASPYPSSITVSGVPGVISKVRVSLRNLTHGYPADLDMLLVGPTGQSLVLMSDVGGIAPGVTNVSLTFDDDSAYPLDPVANPFSSTYQPTNGVDADVFPAPAPTPSPATSLSVFNGTNPNGVWSLYILDDSGGDSGIITDGWSIDFITAIEVCNPGGIAIFDNSASAPYPSPLNVAGVPPAISKVTLKLKGLSHTYPDDIDMLLVGPGGQSALVMSDAGGTGPGVSNETLVIDDNAALMFDLFANPVNGTYQPLDLTPGDTFPGLAPPGPYTSDLFRFDGTNPNGFWYLYVLDDTGGDSGSIGSWCLDITAITPVEGSNPAFNAIPSGQPSVTQGPAFFYPSNIQVTGTHGAIANTTVTLNGLTHTYPQDLDILLTGPIGGSIATAVLMSDVGGVGPGVSGVNLTFDANAASPLPVASNPASGTYQPNNDDSAGPDTFPAPAPAGPYGSLSDFNLSEDPIGTWSLYVYDDAGGDVGYLAGGWSLTIQTFLQPLMYHSPGHYCNFGFPTIPDGAPGVTQGAASYYPLEIPVLGYPHWLDHYKPRVELWGLSHAYPQDLDIVLEGPDGHTTVLMSDAGGTAPMGSTNLIFDDDAAASIPQSSAPTAGVYRPTDYDDGFADNLSAPCPPSCSFTPPSGPFGKTLSTFKGRFTGAVYWTLWIMDDSVGDTGSLGFYCIDFRPSPESGEVPNLRWTSDTALAWDVGNNATSYNVYRGDRSQLPALLDPTTDSCARSSSLTQESPGLTEVPALGSFYWYLVRGHNFEGDGPAGFTLRNSQTLARIQEATGVCP